MNLGDIFDKIRRMAAEGNPEEAINKAADIKEQAENVFWVSKNPVTRKKMSEIIRGARGVARDIRVSMAPGFSNISTGRKVSFTKAQLRAFRNEVLKNIRVHCSQLYGRGTMSREACRIASAIAAAEISDVMKEKFGISF